VTEIFHKFASKVSTITGSPWAFVAAVLTIATWAISGPIFHFSDTWQLVINTGTTIITFLMVFLIQRTGLVELEQLSDDQLDDLQKQFDELRKKSELAISKKKKSKR
jgi:low affinity Fe/Cu permease